MFSHAISHVHDVAIVGTLAAEMIRVWVIYGQIAFYIGVGCTGLVMLPCMWFSTKVVFTTVALRRACRDYEEKNKRATAATAF